MEALEYIIQLNLLFKKTTSFLFFVYVSVLYGGIILKQRISQSLFLLNITIPID